MFHQSSDAAREETICIVTMLPEMHALAGRLIEIKSRPSGRGIMFVL
jgi:hypothetical protein